MSSPFDFDRRLTAWLDEQAPMREPEGLADAVLARTRRTRQLPGWATLERWLPMETRYKFGAVPRTAIILVILAVLLAVLSAIAVGQQPSPKLPPPLGVARNGLIAFDDGGDIWVVNPDGTGRTALTSGRRVGRRTGVVRGRHPDRLLVAAGLDQHGTVRAQGHGRGRRAMSGRSSKGLTLSPGARCAVLVPRRPVPGVLGPGSARPGRRSTASWSSRSPVVTRSSWRARARIRPGRRMTRSSAIEVAALTKDDTDGSTRPERDRSGRVRRQRVIDGRYSQNP